MEENKTSEPGAQNGVPAALTPEQRIVNNSVTLIKTNLPYMLDKKTRALAGLSLVQKVTNAEEDKIANNMLIKGKITFDDVVSKRKEITVGLDAVKDVLMTSEKAIDAEMFRIKGLRNKFAQAEMERQNKIKKDAEDLKNKTAEIIRIKAAIKQAIVNGCFNAVTTMESNIKAHVATMTLENWDEKYKKFEIKPKLSEKVYDMFFAVDFNTNIVTAEEYKAAAAEVKAERTYETVNAEYVKVAAGTVENWKTIELPKRKEALEEIANAKPEEAGELAQKFAEEQTAREATNTENLQAQQKAQTEVIKNETASEELQNSFNSQVTAQSGSFSIPKGSRQKMKAIITAPDSDIVRICSEVLFACFSHPKFDGQFKRNKKGEIVKDEDGNNVYAEWLQPLLDFYANNSATKIEGIELKAIISTSARK